MIDTGLVRVNRGNADGSFTTPLAIAAMSNPRVIAITDMNKDGKPDLVIGGTDGGAVAAKVIVLPGLGDGSFGATSGDLAIFDGSGAFIDALAVADLTIDGNPDVMVGRGAFTEIIGGNGDGTLTGESALIVGGGAAAIVASDINNDGVPDAVVAVAGQGIVTLPRTAQAIPADPVIDPPSFSFGAASTSLSVAAGASGTTTLTLSPSAGFTAPVTFGCAGLPAGGRCSFAPTSVTPAGGPVTTLLTISTDGSALALLMRSAPGLALALALAPLPWRVGLTRRTRRLGWAAGLSLLVGAVAVGCGGSSGGGTGAANPSASGSPAGTSNVTVTASGGSGAAAITRSVTLSLTVTR